MKITGRFLLMFATLASMWYGLKPASAQTTHFNAAPYFLDGDSTVQGNLPTSVAAGDLDGDGRPDLAVTNEQGVAILLNNGSGGFTLGLPNVVGNTPVSIAAARFDGNQTMDLVVVNQGDDTVSILLGRGDGTFTAAVPYPAGVNPQFVVVDDFNSDGNLDLAVVDSGAAPGTSGVSILLGNGDGTFQATPPIHFGILPISAAIGDFDGDGKKDLAIADGGSDSIWILHGNGAGNFQITLNIPLDLSGMSVKPTSVVAGDFNRDGKLDLAVSIPNVQDIAVLLGNGDGTFGTPTHYALDDPNFVNSANTLAVADLNADDIPDLVLCNLSSNHVTVLLGKGDGTFPSASSYAAGPEPIGVAIADFNGDGYQDVAAADWAADGEVTVMFGRGDGTLRAAPLRRSGFMPTVLAAGDFDGDHKIDLVTASSTKVAVPSGLGTGVVMLGNGDGTFQAPSIWSNSPVSSVAVGDFDGDNNLDLVATNPDSASGNVSVLLGKGDGSFQMPATYSAGYSPRVVVASDLNGDAKPDLVVANYSSGGNSGSISVLLNLNTGNGKFGIAVDYPIAVNGTPDAVAIGDFNGDGKPDIAVAISGSNASIIAIFLGNGDGSFQQYLAYPAGFISSDPLHIAAADFDGDGKSDIAVTDGYQLAFLFSATNPAFLSQTPHFLTHSGQGIDGSLVAADLDGDGKPDLAVTTRDGLSLLWNTGNGGFLAPIQLATFVGGEVLAGDFYGTGMPALVAANNRDDPTPTDTVAVLNSAFWYVGIPIDTTPPVITPVLTGTKGNNGWWLSGVTVNWSVSDWESGIANSLGCWPAAYVSTTPGTTVTCTATDNAGWTSSASVTLKIDLTPPVLNVPADMTVNATLAGGATVSFSASATDAIDPSPAVTCLPAARSIFPLGTTTVTCTATVVSGNQSTATFNVTVIQGPADLAITTVPVSTVETGNTLTYVIEVANLGPSYASQVAVYDYLPAGTFLISASWAPATCKVAQGLPSCSIPTSGFLPCRASGTLVGCNIGGMGQPIIRLGLAGAVVNVTVGVTAAHGPSLINRATISSPNPDSNPGNNSSLLFTSVLP